MNFFKAIETLKARNQSYVDRSGGNDYSRKSDEIIKALTNYYLSTQHVTNDVENLNYQFSGLLDKIDWFKRLFNVFDIPELNNTIEYDIIKIIDRLKCDELNICNIYRLQAISEEIKDTIGCFVKPLIYYYNDTFSHTFYRSVFTEHTNYFNDIDSNSSDIDNIIYSAYRFAVSRLSFKPTQKNWLISSHIEAGYKYSIENGTLKFYK